MRIVSLLPSATEMICLLGLENQLVGVTHECDYPPSVRQLPKVTRTLISEDASSREIDQLVREQLKTKGALYTLNLSLLQRLQPDLIVTQALCDVCAVAEEEVRAAACSLPGDPHVINLEPMTLAEVFASIRQVALATNTSHKADEVIAQMSARVEMVERRSRELKRKLRVALLEWLDPPFSCGHWNPELVRLAGGTEGLGREGEPSRTLDWAEVAAWQPQVIVVACCGYNVERTLRDVTLISTNSTWLQLPAVRSNRVYAVDGSAYFSRPGPRLVDSLEILGHALHPEVHPLAEGLPAPVGPEVRRQKSKVKLMTSN